MGSGVYSDVRRVGSCQELSFLEEGNSGASVGGEALAESRRQVPQVACDSCAAVKLLHPGGELGTKYLDTTSLTHLIHHRHIFHNPSSRIQLFPCAHETDTLVQAHPPCVQ